MPRINITEHSETYSFQTKSNAYATVAFPIAAIWGPAYVPGDEDANPDWVHFSSGYRGTTDFMQTFRGANTYLGAREKSFDYALKLLAAGYDILVKRVDGLGDKSRNSIYVVPTGEPDSVASQSKFVLNPVFNTTPTATTYGSFLYRLLLPHVVDHSVVWDYSYSNSDSVSITAVFTDQEYDKETDSWKPTSGAHQGSNYFKVSAKTYDLAEQLVVVLRKPTITSTRISYTGQNITVTDPNPPSGGSANLTVPGQQVTFTGTVPVLVYNSRGILLESRNISMTETAVYLGESATQGNTKVILNNVNVPEFEYIQIECMPALLSLKVALTASVTNLFSSDAADVRYGLFTTRIGSAWTASTEMSAAVTVTGTGITSATVDKAVFNSTVDGTSGTYTFSYDGTSWKLNSKSVTLIQYGITAEGTPVSGDSVEIAFVFGRNADVVATAEGTAAIIGESANIVKIQARYPGSYGNNLKVRITCGLDGNGYKIGTVEVYDNNGYQGNPNSIVPTDSLLELVSVAFDKDAATDSRPLITEASFGNLDTIQFVSADSDTTLLPSNYPVGRRIVSLYYGTDYAIKLGDDLSSGTAIPVPITAQAIKDIVATRFSTGSSYYAYISNLADYYAANDTDSLIRLYNQQIMYARFYNCVGELTDPIVYDWDALVQGIADDQYVPKSYLENNPQFIMEYEVSTLTTKMVEVAANSKCGAAFIGTPFGMPRGIQTGTGSTTIKTGAIRYKDQVSQAVGKANSTFGEVVGPWCKTTLALSGANSWIAPEIAHLLLIINANGVNGINKWWMIPAGMLGSGIVHTPEYKIKRSYLDLIQDHDQGVCLNPLMEVPGKGFTCFGNSTLWDKPLGTYNALQNLSTRLLTNRVKQRIWDTALQILFRYNNEDAYSHFYAGLSPLLDEMRSVGALTGNDANPWGYRIVMNPDIINLDRINANTVIGKVELAVTGVIDTVDVDLFLLPPTGFQETYD